MDRGPRMMLLVNVFTVTAYQVPLLSGANAMDDGHSRRYRSCPMCNTGVTRTCMLFWTIPPKKGVEEASLEKPLDHAFVAHLKKQQANAGMICQLLVPKEDEEGDNDKYRPMQQYDLDVVPLNEEDGPHVHFRRHRRPWSLTSCHLRHCQPFHISHRHGNQPQQRRKTDLRGPSSI